MARLRLFAAIPMIAAMKPGRILSLLVALAVLLMPAGMSAPAMAASHDMKMMEHCAEQPLPDREQAPESCCIVACAAFLADTVGLDASPTLSVSYRPALLADHHGLPAEAATPPPRFS